MSGIKQTSNQTMSRLNFLILHTSSGSRAVSEVTVHVPRVSICWWTAKSLPSASFQIPYSEPKARATHIVLFATWVRAQSPSTYHQAPPTLRPGYRGRPRWPAKPSFNGVILHSRFWDVLWPLPQIRPVWPGWPYQGHKAPWLLSSKDHCGTQTTPPWRVGDSRKWPSCSQTWRLHDKSELKQTAQPFGTFKKQTLIEEEQIRKLYQKKKISCV